MDRSRLLSIVGALAEVGYEPAMLRREFPVWTDHGVSRVDLAGFADTHRCDMSTSTLICVDGDDGSYDQAFRVGRAFATPALLIAGSEQLEVWNIARTEEPVRLGDASYANLNGSLRQYQAYLEPKTLFSAKRGRQLALFPQAVELMTSARRNAADRLASIVEGALRETILTLNPTVTDIEDARQRENDTLFANASQLTIGALTELMIAAKFEVSEQDETLLRSLLRANFHEFASWRDSLRGPEYDAFQVPLGYLGIDVDYSGLEPSLVSEVYETALLPKRSYKGAGIFYTPPDLARRLVELLPVEELPPDQRNVLDPTCGSGTLLLAAHDRLEQLDPEPDIEHIHQRLLSSLFGWDNDPFAVNIARLCLLLNALPQGNGWKISQRDALEQTTKRLRPVDDTNPADIVVMNPPWMYVHNKRNAERASQFLNRGVELTRPGGLIGVVMPASWLTKHTCRQDRQLFLDRCELMEVVRLPERVFGGAEYAPALLIAKRMKEDTSRAEAWLHRRVVLREYLPDFFRSGFVNESEIVSSTDDGANILTTNGLVKTLRQRHWQQTLGDVADVLSVPPVEDVNAMSGRGDWLWLRKAGSIPAFGSVTRDTPLQRVTFPDDFSRGEDVAPRSFDEIKVLVSSQKRPDNPWRLKPLLDLIGVIPRNSLYLVVATADRGRRSARDEVSFVAQLDHPGEATLALFALLGSAVASAWVDGQSTILNIHRELILSLPLPGGWMSLANFGRRLAVEAREARVSPETGRELDEAVFQLYGLTKDEQRQLRLHMAGFAAPEGRPRYTMTWARPRERYEPRRYGATLSIDSNQLLLWAPGITDDEGIWVRPPLSMPGAAAREGATFTIRGDDLADGSFSFQECSFIDDEALTQQRSS